MAKTVLVVDDDPTQRRLVQAVLDRGVKGVQIPHINTRADAERAVAAVKFGPGAGRGPKPTARASAARRAGRSGGVPSVLRRLPAARGTAAS